VAELVVEFSPSAYMTDTQLSRLKRIPAFSGLHFILNRTTIIFFLLVLDAALGNFTGQASRPEEAAS
jgi:hypothetical protein